MRRVQATWRPMSTIDGTMQPHLPPALHPQVARIKRRGTRDLSTGSETFRGGNLKDFLLISQAVTFFLEINLCDLTTPTPPCILLIPHSHHNKPTMARLDRTRTANQLRPFFSSQNLLNRADGSAQFDFGGSSVLCSVVGPAEVKIRDEKLDKATIEVIARPLVGLPGIKDKSRERSIRETLEPLILSGLHPRTGIQIVVQTMKDDGCILSTAFNATVLALLDAGIPLNSILGSVTCIVDEKSGEILLDPTTEELLQAKSTHVFVFDNKSSISTASSGAMDLDNESSPILFSESTGLYTEEEYFKCANICHKAAQTVHGFIRTAVQKKLEKEYQQTHA